MERERVRASSVELLFDAAGEEAMRREWAMLEAAGLSSMGAHRSPSNRPHVTLLAVPGLPVPELPSGPLEPALAPALPLALRLGPPALLPGDGERRVLARAVERTEELLALRAAVLHASGTPVEGAHDASAWLPHVTLAKRLRATELPRALALLGGPIEATAIGLRHWDPESGRVTTVAEA